MQNSFLEIHQAYTETIAKLTPHERQTWDALYRAAAEEGRLHFYVWNYWN